MSRELKEKLRHKAFENIRRNLTAWYGRGKGAARKKALAKALDLDTDTVGRWSAYPSKERAADDATRNTIQYKFNQRYRKTSGSEVLPDVGYLPVIAKMMGITVDELLSDRVGDAMRVATYGEAAGLAGYMVWNGIMDPEGICDPVLRRLAEMYSEKRSDSDAGLDKLEDWLFHVRQRFDMPLPQDYLDRDTYAEYVNMPHLWSSDEETYLINLANALSVASTTS